MKTRLGPLLVTYILCVELQVNSEIEPIYKHGVHTAPIHQPIENSSLLSDSGRLHAAPLDPQHHDNITDYTYILPMAWQTFCSVEFKLMSGSNFTSKYAFVVFCQPGNQDIWSLQSYRTWILSFEKDVYLPAGVKLSFAFMFQCLDRSARLSLPLPIKALHLWYVTVDGCTIVDYLSEYNKQHYGMPDYLGILEITNTAITLDSQNFFEKTMNYQNTSRDFFCGSERIERFVMRNNTKTFTMISPFAMDLAVLTPLGTVMTTEVITSQGRGVRNDTVKGSVPQNEAEMNDIFAKFTQDHLEAVYSCVHTHLRYLEESYQGMMSRHHDNFMLEKALYPELQYFNMSHSGIVTMGPFMLDWRRYFPKMKYIDLSFNRIKYFSSLTDNGMSTDSAGVLDLRHNNITTLTPEDLETLCLHSQTVFVDLRNNPLVCDCKLKNFVDMLKNKTVKVPTKYKYLQDLTCTSPDKHKGKTLASLEGDFCEFLSYILLSAPLVVVSCLSVVTLAVFIFSVKYRKEIMILAFTRLNISLPCRQISKRNDKRYDAFIAYSEHDSQWVFHTLVPRLEKTRENHGPGLSLCLHHRDFPAGGYITDNILDKVKDSRHTVIILSNNFLKSHWCKYEFRAAFTQSLTEKKQHLIMVMQEELDKALIDQTLERCLKTFTYVKVEDRLFWDKLIYVLSDRDEHGPMSSSYISYSSNINHSNSSSKRSGQNGHISTITSNGQIHYFSNMSDQKNKNSIQSNGIKQEVIINNMRKSSSTMSHTSTGMVGHSSMRHTSIALVGHNDDVKAVQNGDKTKQNGISLHVRSKQQTRHNNMDRVNRLQHALKNDFNHDPNGTHSNKDGRNDLKRPIRKENNTELSNTITSDHRSDNNNTEEYDFNTISNVDNDWSLMTAMLPWFKSWFSGGSKGENINGVKMGSRDNVNKGTSEFPDIFFEVKTSV